MKRLPVILMVMILITFMWGCSQEAVENETENTVHQESAGQEHVSAFEEMLNNLDGSQFTCMDGAGNITPEDFAEALKAAADEGYTLESDIEDGYDPSVGYCWSLEAYFEGNWDEGISWNNLHIRAECYFEENLVKVWYGKAGIYDVAYFDNAELYQMILHKGDHEQIIDEEDYAKFEEILTSQMERHYEGWKDSLGEITGYELLEFHFVGRYEEDGAAVELYDFDYALLPEKPEEVMLAGGTSFDSQFRLVNFNGGGQLAVRYRNGEMTAYAFMGNDFYYVPGEEEYFVGYEAQQKDNLRSMLDYVEANGHQ